MSVALAHLVGAAVLGVLGPYVLDRLPQRWSPRVLITAWVSKVLWEALLTPVTYAVVGWLKRREGLDVFDEGTDFTPFRASLR